MKLLHTADWHLGKVIFSRSLLEEQEQFLYETFLPAVDRDQRGRVRPAHCTGGGHPLV